MQKGESLAISRRFYDGDGFCGWHSFLATYHTTSAGRHACARHGRLMCVLCIR